MKIINIATNEIVAEVVTNHSMTLEEAICCVGGEIINDADDDRFSADYDNVIINGHRYWMEDLDMDWSN